MLIATPIWREQLNEQERAFLRHTDHSNLNVHRWFCAPESLDVTHYAREFPDWRIHRFPDQIFRSVSSYSLWLTTPDFYRAVKEFEFVTICQLDAVLIRDLMTLDASEVDYIGAPWKPPIKVLTPGNRIYVHSDHGEAEGLLATRLLGRELPVGNGGLSVRRVEAHISAAEWLTRNIPQRYREHTLEDVLLCAFADRTGLRVAPASTASQIFLETGATGLTHIPDVYGFHGLWRWNPSLARALTGEEPSTRTSRD